MSKQKPIKASKVIKVPEVSIPETVWVEFGDDSIREFPFDTPIKYEKENRLCFIHEAEEFFSFLIHFEDKWVLAKKITPPECMKIELDVFYQGWNHDDVIKEIEYMIKHREFIQTVTKILKMKLVDK